MKRNSFRALIFNLCYSFILPQKEFPLIYPRNYFDALQLNEFSVRARNAKESELEKMLNPEQNTDTGFIIVPVECKDGIPNAESLCNWIQNEIMKLKNAQDSEQTVIVKYGPFVHGKYIDDSGMKYNADSVALLIQGFSIVELCRIARTMSNEFEIPSLIVCQERGQKLYRIVPTKKVG